VAGGRIGLGVVALAALIAGLFAYIGYFGGPVIMPVPATASPAKAERGLAAVLLSGDMGPKIGMGHQLVERLAAGGIPVLAVNTLTYFRVRRTPAENEALIARVVQRALAMPGTRRIVLVGQSYGADMLQAGLPALPQTLRDKIVLVALIVPGATINYRASPSEIFSRAGTDTPALPTARLLDWVPVLCIHGAREAASLCPLLTTANVHTVTLPGGHPLRRDAARVYAVLDAAISEAAQP
jgi:type IV secretory pathway VirJ component